MRATALLVSLPRKRAGAANVETPVASHAAKPQHLNHQSRFEVINVIATPYLTCALRRRSACHHDERKYITPAMPRGNIKMH